MNILVHSFQFLFCEQFNGMLLYQLCASSQEMERFVAQNIIHDLLEQCLAMAQIQAIALYNIASGLPSRHINVASNN